MTPSILVLANVSATTERAARYAAKLGAPLHAHVTLLNLATLNVYPVLLAPELAMMEAREAAQERNERLDGLWAIARKLPSPAVVEEAAGPMADAVATAVRQHQPLLLAMGLSAEHGFLDHLLHNQILPVLRATHLPLLLVPEAAPAPVLPKRVLVALDADPFTPNSAARHLAPLLAACTATYTVAHLAEEDESLEFAEQLVRARVRASMLLPENTPVAFYQRVHYPPAEGILQACADTRADLVVLIARPRSFLGRLFHRSVTAQVISHSPKPVLLLPVEESD
ncbi:universal stress protein [Hymenobacter armeniacus]|uniref:Universal stress protein n=1 Tax=Hymenobacter armeniacus TaxID=2771358 RepID=A0ABR8JTN5_9BACT|nr:universal stress protein [Hymenobacter armeniacus]MBD2721074.1 universal stress protein [Hymenobacter armeniacus]